MSGYLGILHTFFGNHPVWSAVKLISALPVSLGLDIPSGLESTASCMLESANVVVLLQIHSGNYDGMEIKVWFMVVKKLMGYYIVLSCGTSSAASYKHL